MQISVEYPMRLWFETRRVIAPLTMITLTEERIFAPRRMCHAMTLRRNSASSRQHAPEFYKAIAPENRGRRRPSETEGAGKTGCALHPRSHVQ